MWPFNNKYKKLNREQVCDAIYELEKQEQSIEDIIINKNIEIQNLIKKGKIEKSYDVRCFYAKKINYLKEEVKIDIQRGSYLLYNIRLLNSLKNAIDDKEFFASTKKVSLENLLKDQKGLAKFLNEALNTRIASEDVLTSADQIFTEVKSSYEENKEIYGANQNDDELLSVFESDDFADLDVKEETIKKDETAIAEVEE